MEISIKIERNGTRGYKVISKWPYNYCEETALSGEEAQRKAGNRLALIAQKAGWPLPNCEGK